MVKHSLSRKKGNIQSFQKYSEMYKNIVVMKVLVCTENLSWVKESELKVEHDNTIKKQFIS
jgi:hypothetical protein